MSQIRSRGQGYGIRARDQIGRALIGQREIQINFYQLSFTSSHRRNVNTHWGHKQASYNHKKYVSEETMNISSLLQGLASLLHG